MKKTILIITALALVFSLNFAFAKQEKNPQSVLKLIDLLENGAGKSGEVPHGLLNAYGVEKKLSNINSSPTASPNFALEWGSLGTSTNEFYYPRAITIDSEGTIYITDEGDCPMKKFTSDGVYLDSWETCSLSNISGLASDSFNNIYVSGSRNARVEKFTSDGQFLFFVGGARGTEEGKFLWHQYDVAVDSEDNFYVLDASGRAIGNYGVHVFSSDGTFLRRWGAFGDAPLRYPYEDWELRNPYAITIDSQDNVYVVDQSRQVKKFDKYGVFITKWGIDEFGGHLFNQPRSLAVDDYDNIYISDWKAHNIQVFNSNGEFLFKWGSLGSGEGQFNTPYGLDIYGDDVFVVDGLNHRVQKFSY